MFVTQVEHFSAGQRDFLEIGAVPLRAGHVHLVTPCSPTSVWEEPLSDQLRSSALVTFLGVVKPKPRLGGLVARVDLARSGSDHLRLLSSKPFRLMLFRAIGIRGGDGALAAASSSE